MAVITISRQFGAGGKTLGSLIAQKLGYTFIDDAIINKVAEKVKVSDDWVHSIETEAGGKLMNFISKLVSKSFMERILDESKGYIDEEVYIDALKEVFDKFAEEGNCVTLGRGGQYFFQNRENTFHVLMLAELEDRIKFMETHGLAKDVSHDINQTVSFFLDQTSASALNSRLVNAGFKVSALYEKPHSLRNLYFNIISKKHE